MAQEISSLFPGRTCGKEVVCPHGITVAAGGTKVFCVIRIAHRHAFRTLDIHERDGVIHLAFHLFPADMPQVRDAQPRPVNAIHPPATHVLILGNVNAIDPFGMVEHLFSTECPATPHAALDHFAGAYGKTETIAPPVSPLSGIIAAAFSYVPSVSVCFQVAVEPSPVFAHAVAASSPLQGVGLPMSLEHPSCRVRPFAETFAPSTLPIPAICPIGKFHYAFPFGNAIRQLAVIRRVAFLPRPIFQ